MITKERREFAEAIRPAVRNQSDKFSWRLYQRASMRGRERVYIAAWNIGIGTPVVPDFEALKNMEGSQMSRLMIGEAIFDDGWFNGAQLQHVIRKGMQAVGASFSYSDTFNTKNWIDITEWFWKQYMIRGRCIFMHDAHAHSWITINKNARRCEWCRKHERRTVVTQKKITRKEVWS